MSMRYNRYESDKFARRARLRQRRLDQKRMKSYERDTDPARVSMPQSYRRIHQLSCIVLMMLGIGISIFLLASGYIVNIWIYITLVIGFIMTPPLQMMYSQAHTADERTLQIQFGDKPPMPANGNVPGKHKFVRDYRFTNPTTDITDEEEVSLNMECGDMGGLAGAWPLPLGPLVWVAPAQFAEQDNGDSTMPVHAGYMVGNTYHIPVKPNQMRFRVFERIYPDIAHQLKMTRGIGENIRPRTWILYSWEPVSIPEGIPQGDGHVKEMELWESQRRNAELMARLNKQGLEDKMYEKFDQGN